MKAIARQKYLMLTLLIYATSMVAQEASLLEYEKNNIAIYQNASPWVVNISNYQKIRNFWDLETHEVPTGAGSGWVWDQEGHIVTNYHVVAQGSRFSISFQKDEKDYEAVLVGAEPAFDVAVIKLKQRPANLKASRIGNSSKLQVGQKALVIGNPFGLDHTLNVGVISALGRKMMGIGQITIQNMIQTDAPINPGNSGGPLLNSSGEVIGMNTQIVSRGGGSNGLGFAVPIDTIKRVVPELIQHGKYIRPRIGVEILEDSYASYFKVSKGIIIRSVKKGSPADKKGLRGLGQTSRGRYVLGDVILKVNDDAVNAYDDIFHVLSKYRPGDEVTLTVLRDNKEREVKLALSDNRS